MSDCIRTTEVLQVYLAIHQYEDWQGVCTFFLHQPFTRFECKHPQIKAESLHLKHILLLLHFKSIVVVYRAKMMESISVPIYMDLTVYSQLLMYLKTARCSSCNVCIDDTLLFHRSAPSGEIYLANLLVFIQDRCRVALLLKQAPKIAPTVVCGLFQMYAKCESSAISVVQCKAQHCEVADSNSPCNPIVTGRHGDTAAPRWLCRRWWMMPRWTSLRGASHNRSFQKRHCFTRRPGEQHGK